MEGPSRHFPSLIPLHAMRAPEPQWQPALPSAPSHLEDRVWSGRGRGRGGTLPWQKHGTLSQRQQEIWDQRSLEKTMVKAVSIHPLRCCFHVRLPVCSPPGPASAELAGKREISHVLSDTCNPGLSPADPPHPSPPAGTRGVVEVRPFKPEDGKSV